MIYFIIAYLIGFVCASIFTWHALAHIGVYWYQFNRIETIRGHVGAMFWPLLPILIFIHEIQVNRYFNLSFEERMKYDGRVKKEYVDNNGKVTVYWELLEKDK